MAIQIHVDLEAAKFLQKLNQESKDEPTKLATKLFLVRQHMKITGKENSLPFHIVSRAMETIINQHGLDIEGLKAKALKSLDNEGAMSASFVNEKSQKTESARDNVSVDSAFRIAPQTIGMLQQDSSSSQESGLERLSLSQIFDIPQLIASASRWNNSAVALRSSPKEAVDTDVGDRSPTMIEFPITGIWQPDIVQAETNVDDRSPSRIQSLIQGVEQPNSASQQQPMVLLDDINGRNEANSEQADTTSLRNRGAMRTLDTECGIDRDSLLQHSDKKLKDVADILGFSRSTIKRRCREQGILRWPPRQAKKHKSTLHDSVQGTEGNVEDRTVSNVQQLKQDSSHKARALQDGRLVHDGNSIMVKASYIDDIIKFELSISSKKSDLEEEVAKRLNLPIGSFNVKYVDEENDWILVACDADLKTCISTSRSLGNAIIKMRVGQTNK